MIEDFVQQERDVVGDAVRGVALAAEQAAMPATHSSDEIVTRPEAVAIALCDVTAIRIRNVYDWDGNGSTTEQ